MKRSSFSAQKLAKFYLMTVVTVATLLVKKCLALRIGLTIAINEDWLAELILVSLRLTVWDFSTKKSNITTIMFFSADCRYNRINKSRREKLHIAAAFPSACGKTNLPMLTPTLGIRLFIVMKHINTLLEIFKSVLFIRYYFNSSFCFSSGYKVECVGTWHSLDAFWQRRTFACYQSRERIFWCRTWSYLQQLRCWVPTV